MKTIGLTQRVEIVAAYSERRDCLDQRWAEFFFRCGYKIAPLPNHVPAIFLDNLHGLVLTGGNSLCAYGGNAPERDEADRFLIEYALKHNIPLLGVCRGMQSILDYFGTPLVNVEGHVARSHEITLTDGIIRTVNSFHNQAAQAADVKAPLCVTASADGVAEAVVHKNAAIEGIMWHPERVPEFSELDIAYIRRLFS